MGLILVGKTLWVHPKVGSTEARDPVWSPDFRVLIRGVPLSTGVLLRELSASSCVD